MGFKKINCPREDYTLKYTDEEGKEQSIELEATSWDLNHWVDNSSKTGIIQKVHEEVFLLAGEVVNNEEYGVNWDFFFNNLYAFTSGIEGERESIRQLYKQDLVTALGRINEIKQVAGIKLGATNNKRTLPAYIVIIYNNNGTDEVEGIEITR